jgi:hypothetical protein
MAMPANSDGLDQFEEGNAAGSGTKPGSRYEISRAAKFRYTCTDRFAHRYVRAPF